MKGWYLNMLVNQMEQAKGFKFDLQFFAEEPGVGAGTPPSGGTEGNVVGNATTGQAATPPSNAQNANPKTVDWDTHQAAVREMNAKQQEAAGWRNVAKEYGFDSAEQAKQAFQVYKAVNDPNQAGAMVKNYLAQNPDVLVGMLRENPMQAAQIMGQVFNGQQVQTSPYENVTTYDELGNIVVNQSTQEALKKVQQQYDPRLSAIENYVKQQYEAGIKARENSRIPENIRDAVWEQVNKVGIPFNVIDAQPWIIDGLIVNAMGGREKYEESIRASSAQKFTDKVIQNNANTATLTPGSGVFVKETQPLIMNQEQRRKAALQRVDSLISAGS